jgi:hypothetical protein
MCVWAEVRFSLLLFLTSLIFTIVAPWQIAKSPVRYSVVDGARLVMLSERRWLGSSEFAVLVVQAQI